jgi:hypothetical protein
MRVVSLAVAAAVAMLSLPAPAAAQTFAPSGPWEISANEDSCFLKREFRGGESALSLELQRYFPGDIRAVITSKTLVPTTSIKIRYRLNDDGAWHEDIAKHNARATEGRAVVVLLWAMLLPQVRSGMTSEELVAFFTKQDLNALEMETGSTVKTLTLEEVFARCADQGAQQLLRRPPDHLGYRRGGPEEPDAAGDAYQVD